MIGPFSVYSSAALYIGSIVVWHGNVDRRNELTECGIEEKVVGSPSDEGVCEEGERERK